MHLPRLQFFDVRRRHFLRPANASILHPLPMPTHPLPSRELVLTPNRIPDQIFRPDPPSPFPVEEKG